MTWWLLVLIPIAIIFLALCLPLTLSLSLKSQGLEAKARVQWLFIKKDLNLLAKPAAKPQPPAAPKAAAPPPPKQKDNEKQRKRQRSAKKSAASKPKGEKKPPLSFDQGRTLLKKYWPRLWRALHLRLLGELRLALDNPALYGWIYGLLGANRLLNKDFKIVPQLNLEPHYQLEGSLRARLYPIQWLALALALAFEPPLRNLWMQKIGKKEGKKYERPRTVYQPTGKSYFQ